MSATHRKIWRGRIFRYAPLILWIGLIFLASSNLGSMSHTSRIIRPILLWLFPSAPDETIDLYHSYIRKCAHFTEYAILAFWAARGLINSRREFLRDYWPACGFLIVAAVAATDEFNQSFNPARTSSIYDVLLDCAGGASLILIFYIFRRWQAPSQNHVR
jgi:VanZ family protein